MVTGVMYEIIFNYSNVPMMYHENIVEILHCFVFIKNVLDVSKKYLKISNLSKFLVKCFIK